MFAPFDVRPAPTSQGLEPHEAITVGKFEMMHCKVELALANKNGWEWVWFACSNGEHLRGVFSIDGRELTTSRKMLREKHSQAGAVDASAEALIPKEMQGTWCGCAIGEDALLFPLTAQTIPARKLKSTLAASARRDWTAPLPR